MQADRLVVTWSSSRCLLLSHMIRMLCAVSQLAMLVMTVSLRLAVTNYAKLIKVLESGCVIRLHGSSKAFRHPSWLQCLLALQALAQVVANRLGGRCSYAELSQRYQPVVSALKAKQGCLALPIGSLSVGLARHRSLLFKTLADASELPCRLLRGQFYLGAAPCPPACRHLHFAWLLCCGSRPFLLWAV